MSTYDDLHPATLYIAPNCGVKLKAKQPKSNSSKQFGLEYEISNSNIFAFARGTEFINFDSNTLKGWLSPMRNVTLPRKARENAGIPKEAAMFSYLYPPNNLADYIDWGQVSTRNLDKLKRQDSNEWAASYIASFGAYVYFDENDEVITVNAITMKETEYKLNIEGPFIATNDAYRDMVELNRYQHLYIDVFREVGFMGNAWIDPNENKYIDSDAKGQSRLRCQHGGFLFFRHDKTALLFLVMSADRITATPAHAVGSLILDAFRLCKDQLKDSHLMKTTCPPHDNFSQPLSRNNIYRACKHGAKQHILHYIHEKHASEFLIQDHYGWTPLHYVTCFHAQDDQLVKIVVEKCPKAVLSKSVNNLCPIHLACQNNPSVEVIKLLLHHDHRRETLYTKSKYHGFLPIHFACSNEHTSFDVIKLLILAGWVDKNGKNSSQYTDFACGSENTSLDVIKSLIPEGSDENGKNELLFVEGTQGWNPLHRAIVGNQRYEVIKEILVCGDTDPSIDTNYALIHKEVNGLLPIHLACLKGCSAPIISLLLEADPENNCFSKIVENCRDFSLNGATTLHLALAHSPVDAIDVILMKEVQTKCKVSFHCDPVNMAEISAGSLSRLPIHVACSRTDIKVDTIETLLNLNKDSVQEVDDKGDSPLHLVCRNRNVDEKMVKLLLGTESEIIGKTKIMTAKTKVMTAKIMNRRKETPLYLAVTSQASGAHALMEPTYICLKNFNYDEKEKLLKLVINHKEFRANVITNLAKRVYFALIMMELVTNISITGIYINLTTQVIQGTRSISLFELAVIFGCISFFLLREMVQFRGSKLTDYFSDFWNLTELASLTIVLAATIHMVDLRFNTNLEPYKNLLLWAGVSLIIEFIFIVRTIFFPFARFVAGLLEITLSLIPFIVISLMFLLTFTYSYVIGGARTKECSNFGDCFVFTLEIFFFGMEGVLENGTPVLDVVFGILAVVMLLNVVIAIVSNAWDDSLESTKYVYWKSRIEVLCQYRFGFLKNMEQNRIWFLDRIDEIKLFDLSHDNQNDEDNTSFKMEAFYEYDLKEVEDNTSDRFLDDPYNSNQTNEIQKRKFKYYLFQVLNLVVKLGFHIFIFILGLVTLGICWPKAFRRSIISKGTSLRERKMVI